MADDVEIVLVRHGETEWSSSGKHTSYTDVALTDRGREEARALASRVRARDYALVLTSPRRRAIETCELAGFHDHAEVTDDLAEWNYGEFEGLTSDEKAELARLRREVAELREEKEILKKFAAWSAKEANWNPRKRSGS